jgi:hypothetical protein
MKQSMGACDQDAIPSLHFPTLALPILHCTFPPSLASFLSRRDLRSCNPDPSQGRGYGLFVQKGAQSAPVRVRERRYERVRGNGREPEDLEGGESVSISIF